MRRLSGIDSDMLYGETPTWHMHVGAVMILDPPDAPGSFGYDELKHLLATQVERVSPLSERLVEVPFHLGRPSWVSDPEFDLDAHLHATVLPAPGGLRELAELVGRIAGTKLDRTRAMWEMWFVEGLADGRVAIVAKIHHACADGVGSSLLLGQMFTTEPQGSPAELVPPHEGEPIPSSARMLEDAAAQLLATPVYAARAVGRTVTSIGKLAGRSSEEAPSRTAAPFSAPRTPFNHPVTANRVVGLASVPLREVKAVKEAFGATVNDVVLTICGGALRRYLDALGELPEASVIAAVPVSVRDEEHLGTFHNMVSGWFANLATDLSDPVERLEAVRDAAQGAKQVYETGIEDVVMDWADLPMPAFWSAGVRLYVRSHLSQRLPPIFNLLVSNVPGPSFALYAGPARLTNVFPLGPVLDTIGINITVLSYCDSVDFGIVTCPELVPDVWSLVEDIEASHAELVARVAPG
jgi:WS/DGAT/MGAT family acyltransferase